FEFRSQAERVTSCSAQSLGLFFGASTNQGSDQKGKAVGIVGVSREGSSGTDGLFRPNTQSCRATGVLYAGCKAAWNFPSERFERGSPRGFEVPGQVGTVYR